MHIREHTNIRATPSQVWPFLVDPILMAAWHTKIIAIDRAADGPVIIGETFSITTRMSDKEITSLAEVIQLIPDQRLAYHHHFEQAGRQQSVIETYELNARRDGTNVAHTIDLSQTPIPLLLRPLIWFVTRFGKPVGQPSMDQLKQMIEAELQPSRQGS